MRATVLIAAATLWFAGVAHAQDGAMVADAAVPQADAWMSDLPDPAAKAVAAPKRVAPTARIVGSYRPVEPSKLVMPRPEGVHPSGQTGVDLYLDLSNVDGPRPGQSFTVFRKVAAPTLRQSEVTIQVGVVTVVSIEGPLGVARVVGGPNPSSLPFLRSRGVLVGDFIRTDQPLGVKEEVEVKKPVRRARPAKAAAVEPAKEEAPAEPKAKGDEDGYESWGGDAEPIDF
jgi:hypothetical protein